MEALLAGNTLQRARTAWLTEIAPPRRALLVGEGNGRFLNAALHALPTTEFLYVDASPVMLEIAQHSLPGQDRSRVVFTCQDLTRWTPPADSFDLVATHFFLDCFPPPLLDRVVSHLSGCANPSASWLLSDFVLPPSGLRRWRAQLIHALMYAFFRWITRIPARSLVPPESRLQAQHFVCTHQTEFEWGLIRSTLWQRKRPA
jgi:SAM-dependent methyltransferase